MTQRNLKLIAKTDEDLRIISAHLQDSILLISDIGHLKKSIFNAIEQIYVGGCEKGVFRKNKRIKFNIKTKML